jgi:ATP-dependent exoDNAse (exonuclease V) alpha subunit
LARGDVRRAVERLDQLGRVHEIGPREERLTAIANEYVKDAHATLVVSPDNESRQDLNDVVHRAMQREGHVDRQEHSLSVLVPRQEVTGADRQWAERYDVGDVVRYSRGSKAIGIEAGDYGRVERVDAKDNRIMVKMDDGHSVDYDPRRLQGVTLYRESERVFAAGDRVQMTAPDRVRDVANRERGTIEGIDGYGRIDIRWDSGRTTSLELQERRHLDYGYAVTSHSSQGQTSGRVLVHVETERAGEKLVNRRFAYVAVSRGSHDVQVYTDNKSKLARALNRDVSHRSALEHKAASRCQARQTAALVSSRATVKSVTRWQSVADENGIRRVAPTRDCTETLRRLKGPLRRSVNRFCRALDPPARFRGFQHLLERRSLPARSGEHLERELQRIRAQGKEDDTTTKLAAHVRQHANGPDHTQLT